MPATPKSKTPAPVATSLQMPESDGSTVLLWNKGRVDQQGNYHAHIEMLHFHVREGSGKTERVSAVHEPITPGLCEVDKANFEHARAEADAVSNVGKVEHRLSVLLRTKRIMVIDDLESLSDEDLGEALSQTANKAMLKKLAEQGGRVGSATAEIIRTWRSDERSHVRKVTAHMASYGRA